MTEQEVRDFLAQFEEAPKRIAEWPQWMQDAAHEAAATFPKLGTSPDQQKGGAGGAIPAAFSTAQVRAMAAEAGVTGTVQALMRFAVAAAGLSADQQEQSRGGEG